jgi:hypothetical protein
LTSGQQLRGDEKMKEIKKIVNEKAADQQSQKDEIIEMNDKSSTYTKEVSKLSVKEIVYNWLKKFGQTIKQGFNKEEYGKVIVLIGQKKTGKSETVKALCKNLKCDKYIIKFNSDLTLDKIPDDDKKDWKKIKGCNLIEDVNKLSETSGFLILEDLPLLTGNEQAKIYNMLKDSRHKGYQANYLIVVHNYEAIRKTIIGFANAILIYKDAPINHFQIGDRLGDYSMGHAVKRAKQDLKDFHYIFISLDNKKWCNPSIDSRDVTILKKFLKGKLKEDELKKIYYPKKSDKLLKPREKTKRDIIEQMINEGYKQEEISVKVDTSIEYIWKVKSNLKKRYIREKGPNNLPSYLKDNRKKTQLKRQKEILEELF